MDRLGIGIIGTGFIGPVHGEAIGRNPDLAELKAVAAVTREDAAAAAHRLHIPLFTDNYPDLLGREDIHVVHICTPNHLHYPMVKECLLAGKHVLCEKPLALTSREAAELTSLARERNLKGAVNYNLRYYPMVREIRDRNREGRNGRIFALQGVYLQDWLLRETDYSWRLESGLSGRSRAVADIGTHWMDMAQYVTGLRIESVYARFGRMHGTRKKPARGGASTFSKTPGGEGSLVSYPVDTEDYAQILFRFGEGVMGSLTVSQVSAGYKNFLELRQFGTEASCTWNSESPNGLLIGHRDRPNEILQKDPSLLMPGAAALSLFPGGHQEGYGETFRHLLREFYSHILGKGDRDEPDYPTLAEGAAEMALCEGIIESVEGDCWVDIPGEQAGFSAPG